MLIFSSATKELRGMSVLTIVLSTFST